MDTNNKKEENSLVLNRDIFENDPIPVAMRKLALPTVVSMLIIILYNMVDIFFVGQLNDANKVASISVASPIFLLLMAFGNMFGIGGATFISRALGKRKDYIVKNISSFCFYGSIFIGIFSAVIYSLFSKSIIYFSGASDNTFLDAKIYLDTIAYFAPVVVLTSTLSNLVRGEGAAKRAMNGMVLGTITNIILDPIFILDKISIFNINIFLIGMGVKGAAVATIIGNCISVAYFIWFIVIKKTSILNLNIKYFKMRNRIFIEVFSIGLPAALVNILMSVSNILLNIVLAKHGDIAIAAMGVAIKANLLTVLIQEGIASGSQPLIAYNYGAKNIKRQKASMNYAIKLNFIFGLILSISYIIFANQIVHIFISDTEVIKLGAMMLRTLMISIPFVGIMFVYQFSFQAMGNGFASFILAVSRQGFIYIPVLFLADYIIGLNGIAFAQPISDIISALIGFIIFLKLEKKFNS
ncbi:MAG: MATE family efflux transporter [Pleomorphochaeta sp.]